MEQLLDQLEVIFIRVFKKENLKITLTTSAEDINNWDSLSHVLLLNEIEKEFEIQFELEEILNFKTVEDILKSIASKNNGA